MTTVAKEARPNKAEGRGFGSSAAATLGPLPCLNCGMSVVWVRWESRWLLRDIDVPRNHDCPRKVA